MASEAAGSSPTHAAAAVAGRRVALVFGGFSGGGVGRSMIAAARAFLERGCAVDLVVRQTRGELEGEVPAAARVVELAGSASWRLRLAALRADPGGIGPLLRPVLLARKPSGKLRLLPDLVRYLRAERPDALLAATAPCNLIAVWGRRLAGLDARVVVSVRNQLAPDTVVGEKWRYGIPPALLRRGYLQADGIVAVSGGLAQELSEVAGIPRERIETIYNAVVGPHLEAGARAPLDHPWFAPGEPPVILGVGRLKPQKDFGTLIEAFARVREKRRVRLVILGDARHPDKDLAYRAELAALPAKLGVAADVEFPGFVENPFAWMRRAAVFALSSRWEGLPGVLIQALACGCPVVSTDCPSGPSEILADGRFGPLVPVGDPEAFARALERVLDDPPPRERQIERAAAFDADRAVDRYLDLLLPGAAPDGPERVPAAAPLA